jgi:AI-2 transport protein TqsA
MGMSPALQWMRRKGMSSGLALTIVLVVFIVLVFLFMGVMVNVMTQLDEKLPVYKENLSDMMDGIEAWFADRGMDISGLTGGALDPEKIIDFAGKMIGALINTFSSVILMILIILFMVSEVYSFPNKLREKMHVSSKFAQAFYKFSDVTRTYLFTKAWLSAIMAVVVTLVYYAFGTDFPVAWGLLFFVLSFIPNIGFVLSVIPPFFITLLESGFTTAATVVIIVIVLNTIVDNGISPNVMGKSVGISSLVVFLSLMFWVWVLGGIGGLICVPLTLMVKILFFDNFESTQPISAFLEAGIRTKPKEKPEESRADRWRRRIHRKPKD